MGIKNSLTHELLTAAVIALFILPNPSGSLAQDNGDSKTVTLKPGDIVRVSIWRQSDLSGEYVVDEDGYLMLPLIGAVDVNDLSTDSLRLTLIQQYDYFLKDPYITVTPLFRVNVMGEVASPGLYNVDATITLADLLAMAGGIKESGSEKKIMMVRDNKVVQEDLSFALKKGDAIEEIGIRSGDKIIAGKRRFRFGNMTVIAAMLSATGVILSVVLR
ncbi:MAG: polysaccharide biosynthesis/export family protein [Candidatus Glassbacteria bacterium]